MPPLRFILLVWLASIIGALAHGDLHEQIARCTEQIEREPRNPQLYLHRAELHREHEEWDLALADCAAAEQLDSKMAVVYLERGKILFAAGKLSDAKAALDRFLAIEPKHADALLTRARVCAKLNEPAEAERNFSAAIQNFKTPEPDYFLKRNEVILAQGKIDVALAGLDEGIAKLGPIVSLEEPAIDLELRRKNFDGALARIEKLSANAARKERWFALRGEILVQTGKLEEARLAFSQAIQAIERLPANRRNSDAMRSLRDKCEHTLKQLQPKNAR